MSGIKPMTGERWVKDITSRLASVERTNAKSRIPPSVLSTMKPAPTSYQPGTRIFESDTGRSLVVSGDQTQYVAASAPTTVSALPATGAFGEEIVFSGVVYRYMAAGWRAFESDWVGVGTLPITGLSGSNGASPGWAVAYADTRYSGGRVLFRGSFVINGGTTVSTISIGVPIAATARTRALEGHMDVQDASAGMPYLLTPYYNAAGQTISPYFASGGSDANQYILGDASGPVVLAQSDTIYWNLVYDPA